jgi:hypothetical protein
MRHTAPGKIATVALHIFRVTCAHSDFAARKCTDGNGRPSQ